MKNRKRVLVLGMAAMMTMGLAACGGTEKPSDADTTEEKTEETAAAAEIDSIYVYGEATPNAQDSTDVNIYELKLMDDGTYVMTKTIGGQGYGMLLGTTTVTITGTFENGEATDGMIPCELSKADRILYNSYSDMGGYNTFIDSEAASYPVEIAGGEQVDEAAFFDAFGPETTVYLTEDSNVFSLTAE